MNVERIFLWIRLAAEVILEVYDRVAAFVEDEIGRAPPGVRLALTQDQASVVRERLSMLARNGAQGLLLVFLVLWLFFSLRLMKYGPIPGGTQNFGRMCSR